MLLIDELTLLLENALLVELALLPDDTLTLLLAGSLLLLLCLLLLELEGSITPCDELLAGKLLLKIALLVLATALLLLELETLLNVSGTELLLAAPTRLELFKLFVGSLAEELL